MFTGLVEEVGEIVHVEKKRGAVSFVVRARKVLMETMVGDSIAVSGACLTVTGVGGGEFTAYCMPETLERTWLGRARVGAKVNLERSLRLDGKLGGHLVLGHVDATSEVVGTRREGLSLVVKLTMPDELAPYVAEKGSVAVDGVSLTVVEVGEDYFTVGLIPHSMEQTTLGSVVPGTEVNLEADVIARYVHRTQQGGAVVAPKAPDGLTLELLREEGFV